MLINWLIVFVIHFFSDEDEYANVDWDSLGFGLMPTDFMYVTKCDAGQSFGDGQINRYGNIELSPSAGVLNYGQVWWWNLFVMSFFKVANIILHATLVDEYKYFLIYYL